MSVIKLENNIFYADGGYALGDIMDEDFYRFSDTAADGFFSEMCMCNELFYTFIQQTLAMERFFKQKSAHTVSIDVKTCGYDMVCMALSAAEKAGVKAEYDPSAFALMSLKDRLKSVFYYWGGAGYLFLKAVCAKKTGDVGTDCDIFSLVRINQEYGKYEFLRQEGKVYFEYENILSTLSSNKQIRSTVYNKFTFVKKLGWLFKAMSGGAEFNREIKAFLSEKLNPYAAAAARSFYAKRTVHTAFYGTMLDCYFSFFREKTCITGKIMDRYCFLEEKYAKKYGITLINYPHGIEFGFKLPRGFVGDRFYATSEFAAEHFNRLYETDKFTFDNDLMTSMLGRNYADGGEKRVVFFSEAHEPEVNLEIINGLWEVLGKSGVKLVLKPHPKENTDFYASAADKITIEKNFDRAITGNICISRRSTVLVEALYNGSEAYALLTNVSDRSIYMNYPSLRDSRIKAFGSPAALAEHIINNGV
ncbi:MAG: hypothetical protein IJZ72_04965 [Oscillospiraceae bacterium]|nr:hypothetical protein [Oscillospiraceae bacterium]